VFKFSGGKKNGKGKGKEHRLLNKIALCSKVTTNKGKGGEGRGRTRKNCKNVELGRRKDERCATRKKMIRSTTKEDEGKNNGNKGKHTYPNRTQERPV